MLGKLTPYLCIGMLMGAGLFAVMRWLFNVPIAGTVSGHDVRNISLCLLFVESGSPHNLPRQQKPDPGPSDVHDLYSPFCVFSPVLFFRAKPCRQFSTPSGRSCRRPTTSNSNARLSCAAQASRTFGLNIVLLAAMGLGLFSLCALRFKQKVA